MAGEGSVFHMIASLKANGKLVKKQSYFDRKNDYVKAANKRNLVLNKATPEQLQQIRNDLIQRNKQENKKRIILILISVITAFIVIWFGIKLGLWWFG